MSYETGTASDIDDLINVKLKAFATAEGWNVNDDNWATGHLHLSKGGCFVSLRRNLLAPFNDAFSVSRTDHRLWAHIGSAYDGSGGTPDARYIGQPDSLVDATGSGEPFVQVNDLTGPFTSYHLFSGGVDDPDYIYMVAEGAAGFFSHFWIGVADDLGFAWDPPVSFAMGTYWRWWPSHTSESSDSSDKWADIDHKVPFDNTTVGQHVYKAGVEATTPVMRAEMGRLITKTALYVDDHFYDPVALRGPVPLNGVTPLYPLPLLIRSVGDISKYYWGGELSNMRFCSMKGRSPKEELTLGGDTWMLFPIRKQNDLPDLVRPPSPVIDNTSWHNGYAIKKIV